jgi:imidazolonepropionase-like amidohydrolase
MARVLFTNLHVLDCSGAEPFLGEVLVEGNRITAVAACAGALPHDQARIVDGGGTACLMPGLIESHAHLSIDDVDDLGKIGMIPPGREYAAGHASRQRLLGLRHHELH